MQKTLICFKELLVFKSFWRKQLLSDFWEEVTQCDYCGNTQFKHYSTSEKANWFKNEPLVMHKCTQCDLAVANPRPERIGLYKSYLQGSESAAKAVERKIARPNVMRVHSQAVEHAMKFKPKAKWLYDMGCGAGTIMEAAKTLGLKAGGNDINKNAMERLSDLGFEAFHGFTNELDLPKNKYDIVINFDYLEHSFEPYKDLITCNEILKDDGILYLKTLYLDCPDHITKGDGYQLFGQGHFSYFPARTLCSMVYSAGFEIEELRLANLIFITARKKRKPDTVAINHYALENSSNV